MSARVRWLREFERDGAVSCRVGRVDGDLIAEWPGWAELRASRSGDRFELVVAEGADPALADKFYRGLANAFVRHARGEITLHGSAVARRGSAVVLIGEGGDGKSSLASAACRSAGVELVSDDAAAIALDGDAVFIEPSDRVCWLTGDALEAAGVRDAHSHKVACAPARCAIAPARVVAIVKLTFDESARAPELRPVAGVRVFETLARSLFRFVVDEPDVDVRDFQRLARIAESVRAYELKRPRDIEMQSDAASAILQLLDESERTR
jgi:hypothetical protein